MKLNFKIGVLLIGLWSFSATFAALSLTNAQNQLTDQAINRVIPLSTEQVLLLKQKNTMIHQALASTPIQSSQLRFTVRNINLSGNAPPPLLHLVSGYITTVSFVGENGKPFAILSGVAGGQAISVIQPTKNDPYNASIIVNQPWASTNISFYLQGRVRPVTLYLHTAANPNNGLDGNVMIKLPGLPPGSAPLPVKNVLAVSDALLDSLNHAPGSAWQLVHLARRNVPFEIRYWLSPSHHRAIVRLTGGVLVMPAWVSQAASPDQTTTSYAFNHAPLMLWVDSLSGQSFMLRVNDPTKLITSSMLTLHIQSVSSDDHLKTTFLTSGVQSHG